MTTREERAAVKAACQVIEEAKETHTEKEVRAIISSFIEFFLKTVSNFDGVRFLRDCGVKNNIEWELCIIQRKI